MSVTLLEGLQVIALVSVATAAICPLFCWVLLMGQQKSV